eukprot:g3286.t1
MLKKIVLSPSLLWLLVQGCKGHTESRKEFFTVQKSLNNTSIEEKINLWAPENSVRRMSSAENKQADRDVSARWLNVVPASRQEHEYFSSTFCLRKEDLIDLCIETQNLWEPQLQDGENKKKKSPVADDIQNTSPWLTTNQCIPLPIFVRDDDQNPAIALQCRDLVKSLLASKNESHLLKEESAVGMRRRRLNSCPQVSSQCATTLSVSNQDTLRNAVTAANNNGTSSYVQVSQNIQFFGAIQSNSALYISSATIAIVGQGTMKTLTRSSGGDYRIFYITGSSSKVHLENLKITNGYTNYGYRSPWKMGGGLYIAAGTITMTSCSVSENGSDATGRLIMGGGLYIETGTVTMTSCTVSKNSASQNGGGLYIAAGTVAMTSCTVSENKAGGNDPAGIPIGSYGGGLYINGGTATMTSCTLSGNWAYKSPRDIKNERGTLILNGETSVQKQCSAGQYVTNSLDCSSCPSGTYHALTTLSWPCKGCPAGRYGDAGSTSDLCTGPCIDAPLGTPFCGCPSGSYGPTTHYFKTIMTSCKKCPAGRYGLNGMMNSSQCSGACAAGRYGIPGSNTTQCTGVCLGSPVGATFCGCPVGKYGPILEYFSSFCRDCPPGRYGNTFAIQTDQCSGPCAAGRYGVGGSTSDQCTGSCPLGAYSTTGTGITSTCSVCPPGRYGSTRGLGSANCSGLCAAGRYGIGGSRFEFCDGACTPGRYGLVGATTPQCDGPCETGKYGTSENECLNCEKGRYQDQTQQLSCKFCPGGFFGNTTGLKSSSCSGQCNPGFRSGMGSAECEPCSKGKFANTKGTEICETCGATKTTKTDGQRSCDCMIGYIMVKENQCEKCAVGMNCDNIGTTLESLVLQRDYWRSSISSTDVIRCPIDHVCLGGKFTNQTLNGTAFSCVEGNEGILCSMCSDGYYRVSDAFPCTKCGSVVGSVFMLLLGILAIVGLLIAVFRLTNSGGSGSLLRTFIDFIHYVSITLTLDVKWPKGLLVLSQIVGGLNVDFLNVGVSSPDCLPIMRTNYYGAFTLMVIFVIVVVTALAIWSHQKVKKEEQLYQAEEGQISPYIERFKNVFLRDFFIFLLLVYPITSAKALSLFHCQSVNATAFLVEDQSITCYNDQWYEFRVYVIFFLLIFTLGLPFGVAWHLQKNQDKLKEENFEKNFGVFYSPYRDEMFHFESVSMLFKLAFWGSYVFYAQESEMRVAGALLLNLINLILHCLLLPLKELWVNYVKIGVLIMTTGINFSGFTLKYLYKIQSYTEDPLKKIIMDSEISAMDALSTMFTYSSIILLIGSTLYKIYPKYRDQGEKALHTTQRVVSHITINGRQTVKYLRDKYTKGAKNAQEKTKDASGVQLHMVSNSSLALKNT